MVSVSGSTDYYDIAPRIVYIEDPEGLYDISQVQQMFEAGQYASSDRKVLNFGLTHSTYWLHFVIEPEPAGWTARQWRLVVDNPNINYMTLYTRAGQTTNWREELRGTFPPVVLNNETMGRNTFIIPSLAGNHDRLECWLKISSLTPLILPVKLVTSEGYARILLEDYVAMGLFYGLMFALGMYNLLLLLTLRDRYRLFYLLYMGAVTLYYMCFDVRYAAWPGILGGYSNMFLTITMLSTAEFFHILFTFNFLNLKQNIPIMYRWLQGMIALIFLQLVLYFWGDFMFAQHFATVTGGLLALSILAAGLCSYRSGYRPARFYVIATVFSVLGMVLYSLTFNGLTPDTTLTYHFLRFGLGLEALFLSFALADRINLFKTRTEELNAELEHLTANLQVMVDERTAKLADSLVRLEQTEGEKQSLAENMRELTMAVTGQRHDFVNHVQVLKALSDSRDEASLQEYINRLCTDLTTVNQLMQLNNRYLQALINSKAELARQKQIRFDIDNRADISCFGDSSLTLVRILGNMIDNAFEASEHNPSADRWASLEIKRTGPFIAFEVINPGDIVYEDLEEAFKAGITTKNGPHSGLGLFIARKLARELNGRIIIRRGEDSTVCVSLMLPAPV